MMQVQKGLVKYKDRSDILCTYGITDDGKTYYFLEGNVIPNGNIVATTVLVEAIDPVVMCSSIGVIDPNGTVVIPFENKAIKTIANDLLLVEKATPVTESVIEAIELRSDPQSASRLVTTPAVIKENMNAKMGAEGRFVFNDQFSEATICDMDGNNLVNNELYSFVGVTQDKLYLSKNTADSFVSEFSLGEKKLVLVPEMNDPMLNMGSGDASEFTTDLSSIQQNAAQATIDAEAATAAAMDGATAAMQADEEMRNAPAEVPAVDVSAVDVSNEEVDVVNEVAVPVDGEVPAVTGEEVHVEDSVMDFTNLAQPVASDNQEGGFMPGDITAQNFEEIAAVTNSVIGGETTESSTENVDIQGVEPEQDVPTDDTTISADSNETAEEIENNAEGEKEGNSGELDTSETISDEVSEVETDNIGSDVVVVSSEEVAEAVEATDSTDDKDEFKLDFDTPVSTDEDTFSDEYNGNIFAGATLKADSIVDDIELDVDMDTEDYSGSLSSGYLPGHASKDNLAAEAVNTIKKLVETNRQLRNDLSFREAEIRKQTAAVRGLQERAREQDRKYSRDVETLKSSVDSHRTLIEKLETKVGILESKVKALNAKCADKDITIQRKNEEIQSLRSQNLSNDVLAQVLAEARSATLSSSYDSSEDIGYYRRAA